MNIPSPLLTVPLQFLSSRYLQFSRTELSGGDDISRMIHVEFVEFARSVDAATNGRSNAAYAANSIALSRLNWIPPVFRVSLLNLIT